MPAFESINKVCIPDLVDLAVIATPTQYHLQTIAEACNKLTPRFMLCEKPVGYSYSSAKELIGKMTQPICLSTIYESVILHLSK